MPLVGQAVHQFWGYQHTGSITVNMAPAYILAQVGYYQVHGGGLHAIGIKKYRHRPTVDGPETDVDFGSWGGWPSTIAGPRISSVRFGIALGSRQEAWCYGNLYWWS
ncbi:MAG TPA: hypothetical protein VE569_08635 [Acidimicrobiia bacterium]|nr:hypothetical protein [Acidimicrobiia bacterium]